MLLESVELPGLKHFLLSASVKLYTEPQLFVRAVIRQLVYSAPTCFSVVLRLKMNF